MSDNHPILAFNISSASRGGHSVDIVQEVAVRVLKLAELEEMAKEPMCPEPDVHIMLPVSSESLKGVVDRMKNIGNIITVSANLQGALKLRVESDLAKVETEWRDLKHPEIGSLQFNFAKFVMSLAEELPFLPRYDALSGK